MKANTGGPVRQISYKKGAKQRGIVERVFGMKYR